MSKNRKWNQTQTQNQTQNTNANAQVQVQNGNQEQSQNQQPQDQQTQEKEKVYPVPPKNGTNQLVEGLKAFDALLPVLGHLYNTNTDQLITMAYKSLKGRLPQVNKVIIKPFNATNVRGKTELRFLAFVIFDLTAGNDITLTGSVKGFSGVSAKEMQILGVHAVKGSEDFETSPLFDEVMGPIAELDQDGNYYVERNPEKFGGAIASVPVDFFSLLCSILGIDNNSPYDYKIEKCELAGKKWNIELRIYIDNNSRRSGFTKSGAVVNYDVITDYMMSKIR